MRPQSVDAAKAMSWYGFGWRMFMINPGLWIVMMLLVAAVMLILQIIPLVGPLVLTLISPALAGGLMYGAKEAVEGRSIKMAHLFKGLTDDSKRTPMLILGAILLGLSILLSLIAMLIIGSSVGVGVLGGVGGEVGNGTMVIGALSAAMALTFLIAAIYGLVTFAVLAFAIPLTMFNDVPPIEAIKSSINASLKNVVPLVVFLLIYFVLAVIAAIPFFLGFLVLTPVTAAALYASYRDIYTISTAASNIVAAE